MAQMKYLSIIYHERDGIFIRACDVAAQIGDLQATSFKRLESLRKLGLIEKQPRKGIRLTSAGQKAIVLLEAYYETIYLFLSDTLGVEAEEARQTAYAFLSGLSENSIAKLHAHILEKKTGQSKEAAGWVAD